MTLLERIKSFFAWRNLQVFLKAVFKGILLLIFDSMFDIAIEVAQYVEDEGLPNDDAKRLKFAQMLRDRAKAEGIQLKDSVLNLLRELAVMYIKQTVGDKK